MAKQFIALFEQATRGVTLGTEPKLFLPVTGNLQPKFAPTDESRKEFRGADSALGDSSVIRKDSQWTMTLECNWYPGPEVGLLFKHLLGVSGTRAEIPTTTGAFKGILYPHAMPYGDGQPLSDKALALIVNTDEGGVTMSRIYGGARVKSCTVKAEGTDDVKLSFELAGPGEYVEAEAAETAGASFPTVAPFAASDLQCYIGTAAVRTGTAPDFTDITAGTNALFRPDSLEITITNGLEDQVVMNGVKGPSKTKRTGQFAVEVSLPIDYEDPSTGFSSADEYKRLFVGPTTQGLLLALDNGEVAGTSTENYQAVIDLPNLLFSAEAPERSAEGNSASVSLKYKSLYSSTCSYPMAVMTVDEAAAY